MAVQDLYKAVEVQRQTTWLRTAAPQAPLDEAGLEAGRAQPENVLAAGEYLPAALERGRPFFGVGGAVDEG